MCISTREITDARNKGAYFIEIILCEISFCEIILPMYFEF